MPTQRRTVVWADANGQTKATLLTTSAGAGAVQAALAGSSNATANQVWEGPLIVTPPTPVAATFQSVRDAALLEFQTAAGSIVKILLPAPKSAIFLADNETVDPVAIAAIIAAVLASVVTAGGTPVTAYVGGTRPTTTGPL